MTLAHLQRALIGCLLDETPGSAVDRAVTSPQLDETERAQLAGVDRDGLLLTALLVKKLRFEAILRGDAELRQRFERAPEEFTRAFELYLRAEPRRAVFPFEEARCFRDFLSGQGQGI